MVFGWTFTINPQTPKDLYLLHPVTQAIVNEKYELLQKAGIVFPAFIILN